MLRTGILALLVLFTLTGCNFDLKVDIEESAHSPQIIDTIDSEKIDLVALGEACGSKVETLCQAGLYCAYTPGKSVGECKTKDVDPNIVCEKIRKPVCGLKDRSKLGYLNECEAKRHGAKIISEGFCELATAEETSCDGKVQSIGNCETEFTGFEFANDGCAAVAVNGCELEAPFESLEACTNACL